MHATAQELQGQLSAAQTLTSALLACAHAHAGLDVPTPPPSEVAAFTVRTMLRSIPPAVPGIHFLSGAQASLNELQRQFMQSV